MDHRLSGTLATKYWFVWGKKGFCCDKKKIIKFLFLDRVILMRYVNFCKGDVEQAKQLIDDGYTLRNKYPHIFMDRDPTSEVAKQSFNDIT